MKKKFKFGLNIKLILIFTLFALLPITLIGFISISKTTTELENEATNRLKSLSQSEADKINLSLSKVSSASKNLADFATNVFNNPDLFYHPDYWSADSLFRGPEGQYGNSADEVSSVIVFNWCPLDDQVKNDLNLSSALDFIFPTIKNENPNTDNIYIIGNKYCWYRLYPNSDPKPDNQGGFAMDVLSADANKDGVAAPFWDDLIETNNPNKLVKWTPPYVDVTGHGLMISALAPVYQNDKMKMLTGVDLTLEDITNRILDIKLWKTGYAFMIDKEARLISLPVRAQADLGIKEEQLGISEIRKSSLLETSNPDLKYAVMSMIKGKNGIETIKFNQSEKYIAYYPIKDTGWSLGIVVPVNEVIASAQNTKNFIFIVLLVLAVILIILAFLSSKMVSAPIKKLTKGAEEISKGNLFYQIKINTHDEIEQLADSFNQMTLKLKAYYETLEQKVKERTEELRIAKAEIEQEKNRLETILISIGDGVFVIDSEKRLALINPAITRITGFLEKDCLGKPYDQVLKIFKEEDKTENKNFISQALVGGKLTSLIDPSVLFASDGREIPIASSAAPLKDENGQIIGGVVILRDITREREIDKLKSQFISLASHQLRTPATIIKWGAEILLQKLGEKLDDKEKEEVQRICRGSERMVELVNDLLNVSRLDTGRLVFKTEKKQLEELLDPIFDEYKLYLEKKNIKLKVEKPPILLPKVNIDSEKIRQVIIILLDNAIKYSPDNSEIKIKIEQKGEEILYQTSDQGVGIPKLQQEKIFSRFFRADNVSQKPGTGLGLYLAKGLVEVSGGKIWFESEENKGTTFYFTLPISSPR
ncbi:MAG: ATP-binding protein [Patescibacteria group bacterium]|nr:ATP-binding protein [Patescibacteria group bacterium]